VEAISILANPRLPNPSKFLILLATGRLFMTDQEKHDVKERIESEGFDYAFTCYSNFDEVNDEGFHRLRQQYINARNRLKNYIGCEECY
jgi:hypothetical protein